MYILNKINYTHFFYLVLIGILGHAQDLVVVLPLALFQLQLCLLQSSAILTISTVRPIFKGRVLSINLNDSFSLFVRIHAKKVLLSSTNRAWAFSYTYMWAFS